MTYLVLGVLLWSFMHMMPAVPMGLRTRLVGAMGENPYKGLAGLLLIGSIVLMVVGWKAAPDTVLYESPHWANVVCGIAMLAMSVLFFAPYMDTNIKRVLRHPQLMGLLLFGFGHVLVVGEPRGLVLFGGLGLWAWVEILLLNRRDGEWQKPERVGLAAEFKLVLAGLLFYMLFVFIHEAAFGTSVLPG